MTIPFIILAQSRKFNGFQATGFMFNTKIAELGNGCHDDDQNDIKHYD